MSSHKEDTTKQNIITITQLFQVKAHIDIFSYDGSINIELVDSWIDQLEIYFNLYDYNSEYRVMLAWPKLMEYMLAWWNTYLQTISDEDIL